MTGEPSDTSGGARKLYKAGEVARRAGISRKTLHAYVQIGLVREAARTASGYRLYDESVFRRLSMIRLLLRTDHSLQDIRETFLRRSDDILPSPDVNGEREVAAGRGGGRA
jgi:DNA-binding transcriptional MerR regulator